LTDRARQELEAAATLSIFGSRDHGVLLAIAGLKQQAIQYDWQPADRLADDST
jgi:hypothetical protein